MKALTEPGYVVAGELVSYRKSEGHGARASKFIRNVALRGSVLIEQKTKHVSRLSVGHRVESRFIWASENCQQFD